MHPGVHLAKRLSGQVRLRNSVERLSDIVIGEVVEHAPHIGRVQLGQDLFDGTLGAAMTEPFDDLGQAPHFGRDDIALRRGRCDVDFGKRHSFTSQVARRQPGGQQKHPRDPAMGMVVFFNRRWQAAATSKAVLEPELLPLREFLAQPHL